MDLAWAAGLSRSKRPVADEVMGDSGPRRRQYAVQLSLDHGLGVLAAEPPHRLQFRQVWRRLPFGDVGDQAQHKVGREGPWLAGVVARGDDGKAGLFPDLARAGFLDGLSGLDEPGQS